MPYAGAGINSQTAGSFNTSTGGNFNTSTGVNFNTSIGVSSNTSRSEGPSNYDRRTSDVTDRYSAAGSQNSEEAGSLQNGSQNGYDHENDSQEAFEPSQLRDHIPGVDMQKSLETYGSVAIYHSILKTYYSDLCQKETELQELFDSRDGESFTICVHALKSASRGAGANELGDLAYDMEKAGNSDDWLFIEEHFSHLMEEVHRMIENVGYYVNNYLSSEPYREAEQSDAFDPAIMSKIREASAEMDYMTVEELLQELNKHVYPPKQSDLLQQMLDACSSYDYEKLDQLIQNLG